MGVQKNFERSRNFIMGGLCSKKKIADAETENNENEENTDKTPVGERRPTKGAGLLGKTEWTDDEDEEEESVAENAPALVAVDSTPASEEAPVAENQAEENQEAEKEAAEAPEANENVEISDEPIQETKESQPGVDGNSPETEPADQ